MRTSKQGSKAKQHKQSDHNPGGSPSTSATPGTREDRSRVADMGVGDGQDDERDAVDTNTEAPPPAGRKQRQPRPDAGGAGRR